MEEWGLILVCSEKFVEESQSMHNPSKQHSQVILSRNLCFLNNFLMSMMTDIQCPSIQKLVDEMNIELLTHTPAKLELKISNTQAHIMAAIRNIIMTHNYSMRFEHLLVMENTAEHVIEETFALELGKIPIRANPDDFVLENELAQGSTLHNYDVPHRQPWQRPYERDYFLTNQRGYGTISRPGCPEPGTIHSNIPIHIDPRTHLLFSLDVECKMEAGVLVNQRVFTSHLKWIPLNGQSAKYAADIEWMNPNIELLKLAKKQRVRALIVAAKGQGYEHIKWNPANAHWRAIPVINVRNNEYQAAVASANARSSVRDIEDIANYKAKLIYSCPRKLIRDRADGTLFISNVQDCDLCMECESVSLIGGVKRPVVEVKVYEDEYIFTVESLGCQDSLVIFRRALEHLVFKFDELRDQFRAWNSTHVPS
jgi:DNA-directed RNA polymerase alpha subunit